MAQSNKSSKDRLTAILLAAGKGTRMNTNLPKVLHPVAGVPMISRTMEAVKNAGANEVRVVVGFGSDLVQNVVKPMEGICFKQEAQKGTADAVKSAQPETIEGVVIILNGDHPLLREEDIKKIVSEFENNSHDLCVVTSKLKKPKSFGRIVRHNGFLKAIVEAKDASHETLKINEVNTGIYITHAEILNKNLSKIEPNNAQNEYYLTDIVSVLSDEGKSVGCIEAPSRVSFGVNTQAELAKATQLTFLKKAKDLMDEGVIVLDPNNIYIEDSVKVGMGAVLYPGVYLRGNTQVGSYSVIEPNCFIYNSQIAPGVVIKAMSHLEDSVVLLKAQVGPYARLRPGSQVGEEARIGNFVELKNVKFGKGSKAGHLSYLGDAEIGENVNIGCGTITCNYAADKKKYKTIIGDNTFVGSDSQFVAPISVGKNVVIGSGSTITKDVPDGSLAVARSKQFVKENYKPKSPDDTKDS